MKNQTRKDQEQIRSERRKRREILTDMSALNYLLTIEKEGKKCGRERVNRSSTFHSVYYPVYDLLLMFLKCAYYIMH